MMLIYAHINDNLCIFNALTIVQSIVELDGFG